MSRSASTPLSNALLVDDVVITGKLAPAWLKANRARLEVAKADGPDALEGLPADVQMLVNSHKAGKISSSAKLVSRLSKGGDDASVRQGIVEALSTGPRKAVRQVTELLYHPDESVRAEGIGIVKALLGKTFGYKPKAKESRRSAAIKKMNDALDKNPKLLED